MLHQRSNVNKVEHPSKIKSTISYLYSVVLKEVIMRQRGTFHSRFTHEYLMKGESLCQSFPA